VPVIFYCGDSFTIECPTGSGRMMKLDANTALAGGKGAAFVEGKATGG